VTRAQIIQHRDGMARLHQDAHHVRPNVACAADD
jgi:hypothetical protein